MYTVPSFCAVYGAIDALAVPTSGDASDSTIHSEASVLTFCSASANSGRVAQAVRAGERCSRCPARVAACGADHDDRGRVVDEREADVRGAIGRRDHHDAVVDRHVRAGLLDLADRVLVEARHRLRLVEAVDHDRAGRRAALGPRPLQADRDRAERRDRIEAALAW